MPAYQFPLRAMSTVQPGSFLTLHYRLIGPDGADVVSTFAASPATLTLGTGQLTPALEARLLGLAEGARARFELPAGEAFGEREPAMIQRVSRALLARHSDPQEVLAVGDAVEFPAPDGVGRVAGVVRELGEDSVLFDFNHPLASQPVGFEVHVIGVM